MRIVTWVRELSMRGIAAGACFGAWLVTCSSTAQPAPEPTQPGPVTASVSEATGVCKEFACTSSAQFEVPVVPRHRRGPEKCSACLQANCAATACDCMSDPKQGSVSAASADDAGPAEEPSLPALRGLHPE